MNEKKRPPRDVLGWRGAELPGWVDLRGQHAGHPFEALHGQRQAGAPQDAVPLTT